MDLVTYRVSGRVKTVTFRPFLRHDMSIEELAQSFGELFSIFLCPFYE